MREIGQQGLGRSLYEACTDGLETLASAGHAAADRRVLAYFPHARRNPFQSMLYARGFDHGFACFPVRAIADVADVSPDCRLILHYHWLHKVFDKNGSASKAKKAATRFLDSLKRQKDHGHTIVWTVHNIISHAAPFPEEEQFLRAGMAEAADVIHAMNPKTVELCRDVYPLDEGKIIQVPHPSYQGVYGDYMCAQQARFDLDLRTEDKVFLLFGSLGPHKGTRQFLGGLDRLQERLEGKARVVIAGAPGDADFMDDLMVRTAGRSDVQLIPTHVGDQAVQMFFKAADVVVCPYPKGLNSGVMATAATFARPVVVPEMMAGCCADSADFAVSFKSGDMEGCIDACVRALDVAATSSAKNALAAWATNNRPELVSAQFFETLRGKLQGLS